MKFTMMLFTLLCCSFAVANTFTIGCNEQTLECSPERGCMWLTNMGQAGEVQLTQIYSGPDFELWKGSFSGMVYGQYPFNVGVTQKVFLSTGEKENFLNIQLEVNGVEINASGKSQVSIRYKKDDFGTGFASDESDNQ